MTRWEPNARGRLEQAAMELYSERGFEQTTVSEITKRAGLTERTFFRYFTDKREVLFSGGGALEEILVTAVVDAPRSLAPIDVAAVALGAVGVVLQERREHAQRRQAIINANAELRERELIKLATLAAALAGALRRRGTSDAVATLAAEAAVAVFRVAFERWVGAEDSADFGAMLGECLDELKAMASGGT